MKPPSAWRREPTASRLLIVAALPLAGMVVIAMVLGGPGSWLGLLAPMIVVPALILPVVLMIRRSPPNRMTFDVADGAFLLQPLVPAGLNVATSLMLLAVLTGTTVARDFAAWELVFVLPLAILLIPVVVLAWRGARYALTPTGIHWRTPINSVTIPWEALAPDGPPRPRLSTWTGGRIQLATTHPELVVKKGWHPFGGAREFPVLALQSSVHPWLVADAIRWYAEHPEHRAGIGTRAEHDRLLATLAPKLSAPEAAAARPPRPQTVTAAAWLTWAGVAWGLLFAGWNLFVALAFHDRIVAAEAAANRQEELATGMPAGVPIIDRAAQATGYAIAGLVLAVVTGAGAVLLARSMLRGSDRARTVLIVLCGAIVVWALCGASTTAPMLLAETLDPLGDWMVLSGMANLAAATVLGVAICVLLLLDPANRYFRPPGGPH